MRLSVVLLAIALLIQGVVNWLYGNHLRLIKSELEQLQAEQPQQPTATDIVMFCQELAAQTTNAGWRYKGCVEELMNTVKGEGVKVL